MNEKLILLFKPNVRLNVPVDHLFINIIGTNFYGYEYSTECCLLYYNGVFNCYVYCNLDLLTSFKNKLKVLQCFQLQKFENTTINNPTDIFKLFVLRKNCIAYFCALNGKQLITFKEKTVTEN
jgi:hypothetical protein